MHYNKMWFVMQLIYVLIYSELSHVSFYWVVYDKDGDFISGLGASSVV